MYFHVNGLLISIKLLFDKNTLTLCLLYTYNYSKTEKQVTKKKSDGHSLAAPFNLQRCMQCAHNVWMN